MGSCSLRNLCSSHYLFEIFCNRFENESPSNMLVCPSHLTQTSQCFSNALLCLKLALISFILFPCSSVLLVTQLASIVSNIAFGEDNKFINNKKVLEVIRITQLNDLIRSLKNGIHYVVGEDGKNLSFGQKQRIAIARALYTQSDLLVIDEGTSALDKKTQSNVIDSLNNLDNKPAIIMVAHRIEILDDYDAIYELKDGMLKKLN